MDNKLILKIVVWRSRYCYEEYCLANIEARIRHLKYTGSFNSLVHVLHKSIIFLIYLKDLNVPNYS